jgi:hypothetical protein
MGVFTQLGQRRRARRCCVRTRRPPLGTHRRARRRRPRRAGWSLPARGRRQTTSCDPGATVGAASGPQPPGPAVAGLGGAFLQSVAARTREAKSRGRAKPRDDATRVIQQATRAAGRSPPADRRPGLLVGLNVADLPELGDQGVERHAARAS